MSGGGGQQSSTSTTVKELSPEQQKILGLAVPTIASYFLPGGGVTVQDFPGAKTVGVNPLETLGQQMALGAAGGQMGASQAALSGSEFVTGGAALDPNTNPALQNAINAAVRPISENFGEMVLPNIRSEAIQAGGYGGNRQGIAEGMASRDYLRQVGDTSADLVNKAYQSGLEAMSKGLATAPGVIGAATEPAQTVSGVGAQQRAFEQAQLNEEVQRFFNEQFLPFMLAQEAAGVAFGVPGGQSTSNAIGPGGNSTFQNLVGVASILGGLGSSGLLGSAGAGGAAGTGLLGAIFSDRRLKSNIRRVGTHSLGVGLYEYDIFGHRERGVMADEVLIVRPRAVMHGADGYLRVNYLDLTV